jgi:hypothetical protein
MLSSTTSVHSHYLIKNLEKAWLTHSFHCCAFAFPSRHDPTRHEQQLELIERFKSECKVKGFSQPVELEGTAEVDEHFERTRARRATIRLIRSHEIFANKSHGAHHIEESENCFDDFCDGWSDKPAPSANDSFEAVCGNLTLT